MRQFFIQESHWHFSLSQSFLIISAAFSPIIRFAAIKFPEILTGMTLESATLKLWTPYTFKSLSTTASLSDSGPILAVPLRCLEFTDRCLMAHLQYSSFRSSWWQPGTWWWFKWISYFFRASVCTSFKAWWMPSKMVSTSSSSGSERELGFMIGCMKESFPWSFTYPVDLGWRRTTSMVKPSFPSKGAHTAS